MSELQPSAPAFVFETVRLEGDGFHLSYDLAGTTAIDRLFGIPVLVCRVRPQLAVETYGADRNLLRTLHHVIEHGVRGKRVVPLPHEVATWSMFVRQHLPQANDPTDDVYFVAGETLNELMGVAAEQLLGQVEAMEAGLAWPPTGTTVFDANPAKRAERQRNARNFHVVLRNVRIPTEIEEPVGWPDASAQPNSEAPSQSIDDRHASARARRDQLLKTREWWDSEEVARHARGRVVDSNPAQYASRLRTEKRLFAVRFQGKYRHPVFQFGASGELLPGMTELLAKLPTSDANWSAAFWLFQPHGELNGRCPADILATDPAAVIAAAEKDFGNDAGV
jgi:hypothetical protein